MARLARVVIPGVRYRVADRSGRGAVSAMDRDRPRQVLRVPAPGPGQCAQRLGAARLLARGLGEAGDRGILSSASAGGLPASDVHDARWRHRGRESLLDLSRAAGGGAAAGWNRAESKEGTGFVQPLLPHEHWHVDISYLNISGTFYYFCALLDGFSRYVVHWEIRASMTEQDVEILIVRAREQFPDARPRIISDNGPQFIARDFKEYLRLRGMTHVREVALLPAKQRQGRTLPPVLQARMHPAPNARLGPGRAARGRPLRRPLQQRTAPQRHRRHRPARQTPGPKRAQLRATPTQTLKDARARRERRFAPSQSVRHAPVGDG